MDQKQLRQKQLKRKYCYAENHPSNADRADGLEKNLLLPHILYRYQASINYASIKITIFQIITMFPELYNSRFFVITIHFDGSATPCE